MGGLAVAALLAAVAVGSAQSARVLTRAAWPRITSAAAILLWQALGLAGGLAAIGALLTIGVDGQQTRFAGVFGGLGHVGPVAAAAPAAAGRHPATRDARRRVRAAFRAVVDAGDRERRRDRLRGAASGNCSRCSRAATRRRRSAGHRLPGRRSAMPAGHQVRDRRERGHPGTAWPRRASRGGVRARTRLPARQATNLVLIPFTRCAARSWPGGDHAGVSHGRAARRDGRRPRAAGPRPVRQGTGHRAAAVRHGRWHRPAGALSAAEGELAARVNRLLAPPPPLVPRRPGRGRGWSAAALVLTPLPLLAMA